jgi:serine/threonine-protein kinase
VDRRTDIWAFGVVLFEMLTGRHPFRDKVALPSTLPPELRRLIHRCLEKDPKRRLQSIGDARIQIDDLLNGVTEEPIADALSFPARFRQRVVPWMIAGALSVALFIVWASRRSEVPSSPLRLSVGLGPGISVASSSVGAATILSPDGKLLVFVGQKGVEGSPQLFVLRFDHLQAMPLSETDHADSPFFSPDGQWIAFFAAGKLKKISVNGGAAVTLCDAPNGRGGSWAEDGTIVFSPSEGRNVSLMRVSSTGGAPAPLTSLAEGETTQRWPQVFPGSNAVLYTSSASPGDFSEANLVVQRLPNGVRKIVQRGAYHGRYLASGHLVYMREGKLFAVPFDRDRLEVTAQPVGVLEGVASNADTGSAQFGVSASGRLVYLQGLSVRSGAEIWWMDREAKTTPLRPAVVNWSNLLFAPDGRRVAMQIAAPGPSDIWVYDWDMERLTRLTSDPGFDSKPVWTPDGSRITFASARANKSTLNLYWQRADGSGDPQRLTESANNQRPASSHPNGRFLAFEEQNPTTTWDLMILPLDADDPSGSKRAQPTAFLASSSAEREPMFSPDGRWLAYHSNESGHNEVYVRPFPGPGGKWQISTGGGTYPTWSRTKDELFYSLNAQIMVAPFAVEGGAFRAEKSRLWSAGRYVERAGNRGFDVHPDGERLAVAFSPAARTSSAKQDQVVLVFNFFDELRRLVPD